MVDRSVEEYHWFDINMNRRHRGWNIDWNEDWNNNYWFDKNVEYIMTESGIKRTDRKYEEGDDNNGDENRNDRNDNDYRYKNKQDSVHHKAVKDSSKIKKVAMEFEPAAAADKIGLAIQKEKWEKVPSSNPAKETTNDNSISPVTIFTKMM